MDVILPKGLRIEVVDNDDLRVPVGTRATLTWDERIVIGDRSNGVMCLIDGDHMACLLPFSQCKIITDNFKKTFKPPK
jgi:hypothetical protein